MMYHKMALNLNMLQNCQRSKESKPAKIVLAALLSPERIFWNWIWIFLSPHQQGSMTRIMDLWVLPLDSQAWHHQSRWIIALLSTRSASSKNLLLRVLSLSLISTVTKTWTRATIPNRIRPWVAQVLANLNSQDSIPKVMDYHCWAIAVM